MDQLTEDEEAERVADGMKIAASPLGRHEVLHTASVIMDMFDRNISEHPAVEFGDEDLKNAAQRAFDGLFDFYQLCGSKFI